MWVDTLSKSFWDNFNATMAKSFPTSGVLAFQHRRWARSALDLLFECVWVYVLYPIFPNQSLDLRVFTHKTIFWYVSLTTKTSLNRNRYSVQHRISLIKLKVIDIENKRQTWNQLPVYAIYIHAHTHPKNRVSAFACQEFSSFGGMHQKGRA